MVGRRYHTFNHYIPYRRVRYFYTDFMTLELDLRKPQILEDAKTRILNGETLKQIAADHGLTSRTLNTWLLALGDEYMLLRQAWIDNMLIDAGETLDNAEDVFPLARAREVWKKATWYAERRDRARYGQDKLVQVNIGVGVAMSEALGSQAGELLEQLKD